MSSIRAYFEPQGALAARLSGFQPRIEQQQMAAAVEQAIDERAALVVEAGTGTGKTFAYLVPALLSGRKVVISTGTKTLQDQLFQKDLPLLREALERPLRVALLKGRANYLCPQRLQQSAADGRFESAEQAHRLQQVRQWAALTATGDLSEIAGLLVDPALRSRVSSTAENCLGGECPLYAECHLMEARRRAQEADLLVVNHHLLMADWTLKQGGFGEVLPEADVYVLDEAHQLAEVASQFFGLTLGSRQLGDMARDLRLAYFEEAGDMPALLDAAAELGPAAQAVRAAMGQDNRRAAWLPLAGSARVADAMDQLSEGLDALLRVLEPLAERGKGLESGCRRVHELRDTLQAFLRPERAAESVQWFETFRESWMLRLTPLDIAPQFHTHMQRHPAAWIFTSATLSIGGDFGHFCRQLGLIEPRTLRLDSPFDYRRHALLYLPADLPAPASERFDAAFLEAALPVLDASRGRAFLLFTSHRALDLAAGWLRPRLAHPLLVQGEASQAQLLERFRELGNAVLLGTGSFWEGVDVRGEALSLVAIDRLPFGSPAEPVLQARIEALNRASGNPFVDYQLPLAVIALCQGAGRLIRDSEDRGVLMIGDHRLITKSYGRVFLESLPPMPLSRELREVEAFFEAADLVEP